MNKLIQITFSHSCDIPPFHFKDGWKGRLWLDADITTTERDLLEEGEEDGEFRFYPTCQRANKRYVMDTGLVNDYTLAFLYQLKLFDTVEIVLKSGETVQARNIEVEHIFPFQDQRHALATLRFDIGETLVKTTCCRNMEIFEDPITDVFWGGFVCELIDE